MPGGRKWGLTLPCGSPCGVGDHSSRHHTADTPLAVCRGRYVGIGIGLLAATITPPTAHACPARAPPRHQRAVRSALPPGACTPSTPRRPPSRSPSSPLPQPAPPSQHNIVIAFSHHASHDGLTRRLMPHDIVPVGRVGRSGAGRLGVALAQVLCAAGPVHEDSGDEQSPFHLIFPVSVVCSVCVCLGNRGWLHRS